MNKKPATQKAQKSAKGRTRRSTEKKAGLVIDVYDLDGKVVKQIKLSKDIFGAKVNEKLLAQAVRVYLANQRQGTSSTKTRGEVAGSTRKIYRQKGTGRARHGSIKAPIFIGGGIVFGPKPRDYSLKMSKKMRRQVLFSALTSQFKSHHIWIIESLEKISAKTKALIKILENLQCKISHGKLVEKVLLITIPSPNLLLAARNLQNLTTTRAELLNPYPILANEKIIFTQEAIQGIEERWQKQS